MHEYKALKNATEKRRCEESTKPLSTQQVGIVSYYDGLQVDVEWEVLEWHETFYSFRVVKFCGSGMVSATIKDCGHS